MVILVISSYSFEFWGYVLPRVSAASETLSLMTDDEIRTDQKRYLKCRTGSEIRNAARAYSDLQIVKLPCYNLLPDKLNIDKAIQALKDKPCEEH